MSNQMRTITFTAVNQIGNDTISDNNADITPDRPKRACSVFPETGASKRIRTTESRDGVEVQSSLEAEEQKNPQHMLAPLAGSREAFTDVSTGASQLVWALKRQPLCDALSYFKCHQGGTYTKNKVVLGLLIAGSAETRDVVNMNSIITCCGGGRVQTEDGDWVRTTVNEPRSMVSWRAAMEEQQPVMIIIGKDHPNFGDLDMSSIPMEPHYVVLGAFFVTEIWQELGAVSSTSVTEQGIQNMEAPQGPQASKTKTKKQTKTTKNSSCTPEQESTNLEEEASEIEPKKPKITEYPVFKLRLQRINSEKMPVYWKEKSKVTQPGDIQPSFPDYKCNICGMTSPKAFDGKSICLRLECRAFFSEDGMKLAAGEKDLQYSKAFLDWIKPFTGDHSKILEAFQPPPVRDQDGWGTEKAFRMGMVCPRCGLCNSRVHYDYWKCGCCGFSYTVSPRPYPMGEINDETRKFTEKFLRSKLPKYQEFKLDHTTISMNSQFVLKFTNNNEADRKSIRTIYMIFDKIGQFGGSVVHERPLATMLEGPGGTHKLFKEIQEAGVVMGFKRYPARCAMSDKEILTRHFQHNFGVIYEFGVVPDNTSFQDAPDVVLKSLVQLTYFGKEAVRASQEIFVNHQWQNHEKSTIMQPWTPPNEMLALAYMEDDLISYHDDGEAQLNGVISTLSLGSPAVMKLRIKKGSEKKVRDPILEIQLRHGDVVTMCDTRLQDFTEHMVAPAGLRRYAMTSRLIKLDYYEEGRPAQKLRERNLTVKDLKKFSELPPRAANFVFQGTQLGADGA